MSTRTYVGAIKTKGATATDQLTVTVDMTAVTRENINYSKGARSWGGDG